MSSSDSHIFRLPEDLQDADEEIEILEVVGLDEEDQAPSGASAGSDSHDDGVRDVVLDLDDEAEDFRGPVGIDDGERLLRLTADFENFKRRVEREREANERHATARLVNRLLPVLDNFERALGLRNGADRDPEFRSGVALIFRQMLEELRREGLVAVDSVGESFDPEVHEAVATELNSGFPPSTVIEELQRGYLLHERLLRPALVKVSVDPAGGNESGPGEGA